MSIRFIYMDSASYLRSQTSYHGIAHSFAADTPNTIVTVRPDRPYVSIGFNQDVRQVIDHTTFLAPMISNLKFEKKLNYKVTFYDRA